MADKNWLVLVPTEIESEFLKLNYPNGFHHCGLGPVASGIAAARLIQTYEPEVILLCGIAGSLSRSLGVGNAYQFSSVVMDGIGAGQGSEFKSANEMQWTHFRDDAQEVGWRLDLQSHEVDLGKAQELVTVCSATANQQQKSRILASYPNASAEDMEGFSVAMAANLASLPCCIVRGISNVAGDRNHGNWQIKEAMNSVSLAVNRIIGN